MHPDEQTDYQEPLTPGQDFYLESGYLVFTEHYLRKRGKCCGSGCRHCPYRKKAKEPERGASGF